MDQNRTTTSARFGAADAAAYQREYRNSIPATRRGRPRGARSRLRLAVAAALRAVRALVSKRPEAGR